MGADRTPWATDIETSQGRTASDNATARTVFIFGPDKKIKISLTYPMTTGRSFHEILRMDDLGSGPGSTDGDRRHWQGPDP